MTPEQQRKMLECAAKACGFKKWRVLTSGLFQGCARRLMNPLLWLRPTQRLNRTSTLTCHS